jgi:hypothetical protein
VRTRRIVYPAEDPVARSRAERLVALALGSGGAGATWLGELAPELVGAGARVAAAGLPAERFREALRTGGDAAYLLPVERTAGAELCEGAWEATRRAPWLGSPGRGDGRGPALLPLVDARTALILRRGVVGVEVDGSGTLRLGRVRRVQPGPGSP